MLKYFFINNNFLVGIERVELSRLAAHAPKACVYTNFTISPKKIKSLNKKYLINKLNKVKI
jgi:hypothetical protein